MSELEELKYNWAMDTITDKQKDKLIDLLLTQVEDLYNTIDRIKN